MTIKERPILFSAPMVRALLDGSKTQTRRTLNPQPDGGVQQGVIGPLNGNGNLLICKHGNVGDRLWVRETFCWSEYATHQDEVVYRATEDCSLDDRGGLPWKPSIFMPRWASRITLEITDVRVERLQDISEADASSEGVHSDDDYPLASDCPVCRGNGVHGALGPNLGWTEVDCNSCDTPVKRFKNLWGSINGPGSWDENPWVWCITFRRINP